MKPLRIIFMGSPEVAVPSLKILKQSVHRIVGVVSQPDKPAGRVQSLTSPAVAQYAKDNGLPLFQPERVKNNPEFLEVLKNLQADLIAIVAYGKILPAEMLTLTRLQCINVHFSLLPKYRGAAPMQWAVIEGEEETGVTTFILVDKVDAGPVLMQKRVSIEPEDTCVELAPRLANLGAQTLLETVNGLSEESLTPMPQNESHATGAPLLKKEDGRLDFSRKARFLVNQIRGMNPWPGTSTLYQGKLLKVFSAEATAGRPGAQPGSVVVSDPYNIERGLQIACKDSSLLLKEVQLEGKKRMPITEFLKGNPVKVGERLGL